MSNEEFIAAHTQERNYGFNTAVGKVGVTDKNTISACVYGAQSVTDGQQGIFIPGSMEMDAVREVAANMGGSLGSSINISTNAGAQLASDFGKGLIQGTSQYIAKKMRTVKVHLKAGYKVMLYQDRD